MALNLTSIVSVPCDRCADTGRITVRTAFPMSYMRAGEPPEDARNVIGADCYECNARLSGREPSNA